MVLLGFLLRRLVVTLLLLLVLSIVTFGIFFFIPADPGRILVGIQNPPPEALAKANRALGTDRPVVEQYLRYLGDVVRGDFGIAWLQSSITFEGELEGPPVGEMLWSAAKVTASLAFGGVLLLLVLAVPLGVLAASRHGGWLDRTLILVTLVAISTHPLVVGLVLRLVAADRFGLAPGIGYCPFTGSGPAETTSVGSSSAVTQCDGPLSWAHHLLLPWLTFALLLVAIYMRMIRARVIEVLREPHVRTARAKGASEWRATTRHALRLAVAPVVPMLAMDLGLAVGLAIYVEAVFGLPGLGRMAVSALAGWSGYDRPVIVGVVLVTGAAIVAMNLLADMLLAVIDPRVQRGGIDRSATAELRVIR